MNKNVRILMATYNGAKYIEEQLDSLINQTYQDIDIFISDDGSTDETVSIIKQYIEKDSRIHIESSNHLGACQNFGNLLRKYGDTDYVMLCDQDDIWSLDKVEKTVNVMQTNEEEGMPLLIYSGRIYVDETLQRMNIVVRTYEDTFRSLLCQCHIYGCTMMLNREMIEIVDIPEFASMHDHWIALTASCKGKIVRMDEELMLYRQHANNVTGGRKQFSFFNKIKNWDKINDEGKQTNRMCYKFCKDNSDNLIAREYLAIYDRQGLFRLLRALKFGYKFDHLLATIRGLYILLITTISEE